MNPFVISLPKEVAASRRPITPNTLLLKALELAQGVAEERSRKTGNWGVAVILQVVISAYVEGEAGKLAKYVLEWQAQRATSNTLHREIGQ